MGVLQRFERRLEGFVQGAFARVFGGVVQPVEVAAALQREAEDNKAIVGQGRVLVPNDFVVELGRSDADRLAAYDEALRRELGAMVQEHAAEQGWSFVGPVAVHFERVDTLDTGVFRVRSIVLAPDAPAPVGGQLPPAPHVRYPAYLIMAVGGSRPAASTPDSRDVERVIPITGDVTRIGRGSGAEVQLADTGVSRLHAEIRLHDDEALLVDLRSTNGTNVNGRRIRSAPLHDGDRIGIGTTALIFRRDG